MAVLLARAPEQLDIANGAVGKYLGRFFLFTSVDVTRQDAIDILRKTGIAGTRGFGGLSGVNVAIDGPEMQRVYKLAAEMHMPVLTHYQDYGYSSEHPLPPAKGFTRPQFARLEVMLKTYSKTIFIGHGPHSGPTSAPTPLQTPILPVPSSVKDSATRCYRTIRICTAVLTPPQGSMHSTATPNSPRTFWRDIRTSCCLAATVLV